VVVTLNALIRIASVSLLLVVEGACGVPGAPLHGEPSREHLIQAVRSSASGRTYTEPVTQPRSQSRTCTSVDARTHRHGCAVAGQTYQVMVPVTTTETRQCPTLPGPDSNWNVQAQGDDKWRVSRSGSVWDVEKLSGQQVKAGTGFTAGGFSFSVVPRQRC